MPVRLFYQFARAQLGRETRHVNAPETSSTPQEEASRRKSEKTIHPFLGWMFLAVGFTGLVCFPFQIYARLFTYGFQGFDHRPFTDNGFPLTVVIVFLSLLLFVVGIGVFRRWRWVQTAAPILVAMLLPVLILGLLFALAVFVLVRIGLFPM